MTYHGHGIGDLRNDDLDGLYALRFTEIIGAQLLEASLGIGSRKTVLGVGAEFVGDLLERQGVGGMGERFV